jgi:hypothetical protein
MVAGWSHAVVVSLFSSPNMGLLLENTKKPAFHGPYRCYVASVFLA